MPSLQSLARSLYFLLCLPEYSRRVLSRGVIKSDFFPPKDNSSSMVINLNEVKWNQGDLFGYYNRR